jgi:type I restriction enzyme S subunit
MSEWKETELNKIGAVISGGTPSTSIPEFWNGNILFVTPFDLSRSKTAYIENTDRKISKEGLANSSANLLPIGSIIISSRAPIGYIAVAKKEFTTNQGCKSIVPSSDFDSLYLYYCLSFYIERIKRLGAGSTFAEISKGDLELVKFPHPENKTEQRQISYILSTADAVIEKTQAAITKYKAIKQGMLHDLFTRGIDTKTGKLRPKYEEAPELYKESNLGMVPKEWDVERFSSVFDIINGGTPSTHIKEYWEGNIPWLSVEDFNNDKRYVFDAKKRITEEGLKCSSTNLLSEGMIIISARGTVGVITQLANRMAFNQSCYGINTISLKVSNDYCYYFLLHYKNNFGFNSFGSVFSTITRDYFDSMIISYPSNQDEMNEIVKRISLIDSSIESEKNYLHKMQMVKAGLMGDLLNGK